MIIIIFIIIISVIIIVYKNWNDHVQWEEEDVLRKIAIYLHFVNLLKRISLWCAKVILGR